MTADDDKARDRARDAAARVTVAEERLAKARRDHAAAGHDAGTFWAERIQAGLAGRAPKLPNLAGMQPARLSWWRRALIGLANCGR